MVKIIKRELREKRYRNTIWSAAGDHSFTPMFFADAGNNDIDFYLNLIIGLTHKWFDTEGVEEFFRNTGRLYYADDIRILTWIFIENTVFNLELDTRPALGYLRKKCARGIIKEFENIGSVRSSEKIERAVIYSAAGQEYTLGRQETKLYLSLKSLSEELVIKVRRKAWEDRGFHRITGGFKKGEIDFDELKRLFSRYYTIDFQKMERRSAVSFKLDFFTKDRIFLMKYNPEYILPENKRQQSDKGFFKSMKVYNDSSRIRSALEVYFGKSVYTREENKRLEEKLCTGNHEGCYLYFPDGNMDVGAGIGSKADIRDLWMTGSLASRIRIQEFIRQSQKNEIFYFNNRERFRTSISKLSAQIRNIILTTKVDKFVDGEAGTLDSSRVWRAALFNDREVFRRREMSSNKQLCVTVLLDASESQRENQRLIASEAYILAESLRETRIPSRILSYCSTDGFTIINRLRHFDQPDRITEKLNRNIFKYAAMGANRDGLALRAVSRIIRNEDYENNLLLVLTDALPEDDDTVWIRRNSKKSHRYCGLYAIDDTSKEVLEMRRQGIRVAGIIYGSSDRQFSAEEIYGGSYVRINNLMDFSDICGRMIADNIAEIYNEI